MSDLSNKTGATTEQNNQPVARLACAIGAVLLAMAIAAAIGPDKAELAAAICAAVVTAVMQLETHGLLRRFRYWPLAIVAVAACVVLYLHFELLEAMLKGVIASMAANVVGRIAFRVITEPDSSNDSGGTKAGPDGEKDASAQA